MKSANEIIQEAIFSSVLEGIAALKDNSNGMPNAFLRDVNSLHSNTTFDSIPDALQAAIKESTRSTLNKLRNEGYVVATKDSVNPPIRRNARPKNNPNHGVRTR